MNKSTKNSAKKINSEPLFEGNNKKKERICIRRMIIISGLWSCILNI